MTDRNDSASSPDDACQAIPPGAHDSEELLAFTAPASLLVPLDTQQEIAVKLLVHQLDTHLRVAWCCGLTLRELVLGIPQDLWVVGVDSEGE